MSVTLLDGFILVVVIGGLIRGYMVGALRQIAGLVGVGMALLVSGQLMHAVGTLITVTTGMSDTLAPVVGFVVLFLGVWLTAIGIARLLERVLESLSLSVMNRAAGGVVGGAKAGLLLSVLFLVLLQADVPGQDLRKQSILYGPVAGTLPYTIEVASDYWPAAKRMSETFGEEVRPEIGPSTVLEGSSE